MNTPAASPDASSYGYDSASPTPSPVMDIFTFPPTEENCNSKANQYPMSMMMKDEGAYDYHGYTTTYGSTFSTLDGWAGDVPAKGICPRAPGDMINSFAVDVVTVGYDWPHGPYGDPLQQYSAGIGGYNFDGSIGIA